MAGAEASIATAARITGRVQGVWFRGWVRGEPRRLGLTGWVRNQPDGSVALGREGPPHARVHGVETTPVAPAPELAEFRVVG